MSKKELEEIAINIARLANVQAMDIVTVLEEILENEKLRECCRHFKMMDDCGEYGFDYNWENLNL